MTYSEAARGACWDADGRGAPTGTEEYRACVALEDGDDPEAFGRSRGVIPGGTYLRARLRGTLDETAPHFAETFAAMAAAATPDPSRRAVEFYRRSYELVLLFPVA